MTLRRADLDPDPLRQFERWHAEAGGLDAVALATASAQGAPSARMVLLKGADERGFVFHSSYEGRKASELAAEPARRAALPLAGAGPPGAGRGRASSASTTPSRRRTSGPGPAAASSPPGPRRRASRSARARSWKNSSGDRGAARRAGGAASSALGRLPSRPRSPTSSGSTATTACTTAFAIAATAAAGRSNGSRPSGGRCSRRA